MYVMSPKEAQEWLNRLEQEGIQVIICYGKDDCAELDYEDGTTVTAWFSVESEDNIYRKKPWHWPKPDENTPIDAKVWCRLNTADDWLRKCFAGASFAWLNGRAEWTADGRKTAWKQIVLANPDNLDEVPPMDLEV